MVVLLVVHVAALCFVVPGARALLWPRRDAQRIDPRRLSLQQKIEHRALRGGEALAAALLLEAAALAGWPAEVRGGIHCAIAVLLLGNVLARALSFLMDVSEGLPGWGSVLRLLGTFATAMLVLLSAPMLPGMTMSDVEAMRAAAEAASATNAPAATATVHALPGA